MLCSVMLFAEIKSLQSNLTLEEIQEKDAKLRKEVYVFLTFWFLSFFE